MPEIIEIMPKLKPLFNQHFAKQNGLHLNFAV